MKRYLCLLIVLLLPVVSCTPSEVRSDLLLSKIIADGRLATEFNYDSEGKLILVRQHESDSFTELSCEYNSKGLLARHSVAFSADPENIITTYFAYNEQGMIVIKGNHLESKSSHYDSGFMTREDIYNSSHYDSEIITREYIYNSNGIMTEGYTILNGEKTGYITYKYDEAGNTIERREYSNYSSQMSVLRLEYDDHRNPIPPDYLKAGFFPDIIQKNNVIRLSCWDCFWNSKSPYQSWTYSSTFEYNSSGLPIKETRHIYYELPSEATLMGNTPQEVEYHQDSATFEYVYQR